ncbi:MAG TPA: Tm-1-like ATP-binding domain-containing protein [Trinickia sp.]|jgi:uncharacterized protein (UPF0261 family)|uniref:Tm-1-like ATP-binding domain-containing protein n=1 Tax=Trinickia sp. TaxID=2571163 RepID=UPI002CBF93FB|nr:Tm-1-like ATP-binding domain-containing protein [Trinickia sp.]HTI17629.1 Tm-1-like ATP-binding domain-containing protein [Trinickia sp.]
MTRDKQIYLIGTFDTKAAEALYLRDQIRLAGAPVITVDVSTTPVGESADIPARVVAEAHAGGPAAVFTGDRGTAITAMIEAFKRFLANRDDVGAVIGLGGSGGTALITPAMRSLPVGLPKLMVSTMASGDVSAYVGPTDITMMHSVTDIAGLNRISRRVLANAAGAIVGAFHLSQRYEEPPESRAAVGLTMFGVTTACIRDACTNLEPDYDCLVFHATGVGGASMEKLLDAGLLIGLLDLTTTEVCDHLLGGILACTDDRFGAVSRTRAPYVGSCGALDMVNFGAPDTLPSQYRGRTLYAHNPQVTLMRTSADENSRIGAWIGERLNRCQGEVRFLLPEGGVSALDAPGQPFHDPDADAALFEALERTVLQNAHRQLLRVPYHINDPQFAALAARHFRELTQLEDRNLATF